MLFCTVLLNCAVDFLCHLNAVLKRFPHAAQTMKSHNLWHEAQISQTLNRRAAVEIGKRNNLHPVVVVVRAGCKKDELRLKFWSSSFRLSWFFKVEFHFRHQFTAVQVRWD